jgi:hypothetical protein
MSSNSNLEPVIACNPRAIDAANRDAHVDLSKEIFAASTVLEVKELPDGYGFRLPLETPMIHKVAQFIANERLCCSFFTFTLIVGDQLWLELTGSGDVKTLIKTDILKIIDTGVFPSLEELQTTYDATAGS